MTETTSTSQPATDQLGQTETPPALPRLMGIVNCTPDSFSDGGVNLDPGDAVANARRLIDEGADIIDIGGESTRPGSDPVASGEQIRRTVPVIERLRACWDGPISIDTTSAAVARRALDAGATWINDVSALRDDPGMAALVAERDVPVVLMHCQGRPKTMQQAPHYDDVIGEILDFFEKRLAIATAAGIARKRIILDPGIGFGKRLEDNLAILQRLDAFGRPGCQILVGASRKSFLGRITGADVDDRLTESVTAAVIAALHGASIIRCHDLAPTRRALRVALAIRDGRPHDNPGPTS